jgi:hypothetical protein
MHGLDVERATFARLRARLAERHEGWFAVLFGDRLVGVYPNPRDAYRAGLDAAGPDRAFLLEQLGVAPRPPVFVAAVG